MQLGTPYHAEFTFVELLQCVPLIRTLHIEGSWMEVIFVSKVLSHMTVLCFLIFVFVSG